MDDSVMTIRVFQPADENAVVELWEKCGLLRPAIDPRQDIRRKLGVNPELFLVGEAGGEIVASVMAGYEGRRGWINYVAVRPELQRRGLGRKIVGEAERRLGLLGCPKVNLQVRTTNHPVIKFYERLGYSIDEVVSMGKRLKKDS